MPLHFARHCVRSITQWKQKGCAIIPCAPIAFIPNSARIFFERMMLKRDARRAFYWITKYYSQTAHLEWFWTFPKSWSLINKNDSELCAKFRLSGQFIAEKFFERPSLCQHISYLTLYAIPHSTKHGHNTQLKLTERTYFKREKNRTS